MKIPGAGRKRQKDRSMRRIAAALMSGLLFVVALHAAQGQDDPPALNFVDVDMNSNNIITSDELKVWASTLSGWAGPISDEEKERFSAACLDLYDTVGGDGQLNPSEAAELLGELAKMLNGRYNKIVFQMDDIDGDNQLSVSETEASFNFNSAGCEAPVEVFDDNDNGKLNYIEATNMAGNVSALSSVDGPWTAGPFKCHTVTDLQISGTFCDGASRVARVCAPREGDGETYAKMKAHCMARKFEEENALTSCTNTADDFCGQLGGSVSPDASCTLFCQQAMSECLIDSDCPGGTQGSDMTLTVYGEDVITGSHPAVKVQVFTGYPWPFYGCKESSMFGCGTLVMEKMLSGAESGTDLTFKVGSGAAAWFLVVIGGENGYGYSYYETHMDGDGGNTVHGSLLGVLGLNMDRLVLSWPHAGDLDLWVFPTDSSGNVQGSVGWNYNKRTGTFGSTVVSLDKDVTSGLLGSETVSFKNMAGGTFQVWVHAYSWDDSSGFTPTKVMGAPATLEVYCSQCHDSSGRLVRGRVVGITQDYRVIPSGGRLWWKAGHFVAPSTIGGGSTRVQWVTCQGQACYSMKPAGFVGEILSQGSIRITAKNAFSGAAVAATYEVFTNYPSDYISCRATGKPVGACGNIANTVSGGSASGTLSTTVSTKVDLAVAFGMSSYLLVLSTTGFYSIYLQINLAGGSTQVVNAQMVAALATDQDRVVLSWGSSDDLDLWIVAKDSTQAYAGAVGWNLPDRINGVYPRTDIINGATVTLDVDNWDRLKAEIAEMPAHIDFITPILTWLKFTHMRSASGPETSQIRGLGTAQGIYEVWVHAFPPAVFSQQTVAVDAAKIDIYCYQCHDDEGITVQGLVKTSTQVASDVPPAGAKWYKVGDYISPSPLGGGMRVQWKSCVSGCWTTQNPTVGGGARRRNNILDPKMTLAYKPDSQRSQTRYLPNGTPMTAIPASVKFDQNPDWIAYKQMNSNMKKAWATVAANKGSHHLMAHVDGERAAGLRAIGGARHQGRSGSMKLVGNKHLRSHGMSEYGYTIGDFASPNHVSAIGDIHLICCDRFATAVRDTCSGVSETTLKTWVDAGMANGWCHETSCFDGQGLRQWAGSLSWLDYTRYRWGNMSFTTRSECQEARDWPDLMDRFKTMEACTGGLGKLLVPGRFHVWGCFHNHPCATRALTDEIGLWILFEQGYRDFSVSQINILIQYVSAQIALVTGEGGWTGTAEDASGRVWGIFTWTEIQTFFIFMVQMVIQLGDVFQDVSDASVFGDLWWVGLESGASGTCEDIGREGFVCRATPCCFYHPMLGCQSQPDSHPCHGTGSWTFSLSAYGWSGVSKLMIAAQYEIYQLNNANQGSYWGCRNQFNCGNPISTGYLLSSGATTLNVEASKGSRFFIIFSLNGYVDMYYSIDMFLASESINSQMVSNLQVGGDRLVLRWNSNVDLDLWLFVRDPPTNGVAGALRGSVGWDYGKRTLTVGQTKLEYVVDSENGLTGPEVTGLSNAAGGVYEVWVNIWSEKGDSTFTKEMVQMKPATVDVYCYQCHNTDGILRSGGVGSFSQDWNTVPNPGMAWWKVGEFIAPSTVSTQMRMQWKTCTSNCYVTQVAAPTGFGTLSIQAVNTVTGSNLLASYYIFEEYPVPYEGCFAAGTCGKQDYNGTINIKEATTLNVTVNYAVSNYLLVVVANGYYASYDEVAVIDGKARDISSQMVQKLGVNRDRVVLRWHGSDKDLDLWVVFKSSTGVRLGSVGYTQKTGTFTVGSGTLDVDNWDGLKGPETAELANIANGVVEVWVNRFGQGNDQNYLPENVRADPAVVDVYCYSCQNQAGVLVQGGVKTVTQVASSVPAAGAKWWKVGQFKAPSPLNPSVRAMWQSCIANEGSAEVSVPGSGCWTMTNPTSSRRRRNLGPTEDKPKHHPQVQVEHKDAYLRKVYAERIKKAAQERKQREETLSIKKQGRAESKNSKNHKRSRYYNMKNLDGHGLKSTFSTPADAAKSPAEHVKNAGREWTDEDHKVVSSLVRNIQFFKHKIADRYGLDKMEDAINLARSSPKKEKFKVRAVDSPAGPREAMCYVYDEAYKNWVPWGPNSLLQIHDWSAVWNRPHWPEYEQVYKNSAV